MIQGFGIDIVCISEFGKLCPTPQAPFVQKHFTAVECDDSEKAAGANVLHLAVRYAAKEAVVKALESAHLFRPPLLQAVDYREIEVNKDPHGRPYLVFYGEIGKIVEHMGVLSFLSLSHDGDYAAAQVMIAGK